jgi:glucose-1-phosphate adenylyltransferase
VAKTARVSYSVLMPGVRVEDGAVVEYAILGEDSHVEADCRVGGAPENYAPEVWGLTVLAPGCKLDPGRQVKPDTMLSRTGEECAK